jgi:hypothetical protein
VQPTTVAATTAPTNRIAINFFTRNHPFDFESQ